MYAFIRDVPIGEELYAKIRTNLGTAPLAGLLVHIVQRREGGLRYIDVWESKEACDAAFEARIHPAVRAAGIPATGEPPRHEISVIDVLGRAV